MIACGSNLREIHKPYSSSFRVKVHKNHKNQQEETACVVSSLIYYMLEAGLTCKNTSSVGLIFSFFPQHSSTVKSHLAQMKGKDKRALSLIQTACLLKQTNSTSLNSRLAIME